MSANSSSVLYIGAIPFNWDVDVIKSVVCGSGPVVDVRCMMDSPSKNKGFCFVEYATPDLAQHALRTLNKVRIEGRKKLRIELSKEGLRNTTGKPKPSLALDKTFLPANVVVPPEMQNAQQTPMHDLGPAAEVIKRAIASAPQVQQMVQQMLGSGVGMGEIADAVGAANAASAAGAGGGGGVGGASGPAGAAMGAPTSGSPSIASPGSMGATMGGSLNQHLYTSHLANAPPSNGIPQTQLNASQFLPLPTPQLRAELAKNKVSEILSNIPPGVLIELLAKLKVMLSQANPNYVEAAKILTDNPQLAVAAAQALLLMGVIDLEVINQAMQAQAPQTQSQPQPQPHVAPAAAPPVAMGAQGGPQNFTTGPQSTPQGVAPGPPQAAAGAPPAAIPPHTLARLATRTPQEAALISQILLLPPEQIAQLPPNERDLALKLREEYL